VLLTVRQAIEKQSKHLAPCRRPTRIILRNQPLPRTATRKIRRVDVQEWACNQEVMS
jgi:acyl-coenzyme A synthetase/AMP-(fatty) acid ligase